MGQLVIVSGPPGAGKSSVAGALASRREPSVHVEGDAFFHFLRRGKVDPWLDAAHAQNITVLEAAAAATARFAMGSFWTMYDGVVAPWALPTFHSTGARDIHYVVLLPDVEVCVERVISRNRDEFRDEQAARHMHAQFATAGIAERHVLRDSTTDVDELADQIVERVDAGDLLVEGRVES
jgi:2-phosphoglycerate kinase